ncbi:MAG: hypothetical protein ACOCWL_01935 [Thermoguttaceae bacterium]
MTQHYLLPCSCGQKLAVAPRQAGESITCPCGTAIEVPPLNRLKTLEPVRPEVERARPAATVRDRPAWGGRQAGLFLGIVLLCVGIPWAAWLEWDKPRLVPVERMTPLQTWGLWQELRTGADRYPSRQARNFADALSQNRNWFYVAIGLSVGGVLVCIGSYTLLKPSGSRGAPGG